MLNVCSNENTTIAKQTFANGVKVTKGSTLINGRKVAFTHESVDTKYVAPKMTEAKKQKAAGIKRCGTIKKIILVSSIVLVALAAVAINLATGFTCVPLIFALAGVGIAGIIGAVEGTISIEHANQKEIAKKVHGRVW